MKITVAHLGLKDYQEALVIQERLRALRHDKAIGDTLLLLEHPPVITLGRRGESGNIHLPKEVMDTLGIKIFEVTRGGDVTYHGPGQIVGYPVFDLHDHGRNLREFVRKLKEVFIRLLKEEYGLEAYGDDKKYTGVWVGREKITAIGLAVRQWVTMHGFAFNVNTNLKHFKWINPCGITDKGVTSLQRLLGRPLDMALVIRQVGETFCRIFEGNIDWVGPEWVKNTSETTT
jgi:lipoyl(octanoyl) transferase